MPEPNIRGSLPGNFTNDLTYMQYEGDSMPVKWSMKSSAVVTRQAC